jgi:predicted DNA-binding protein (UPF0251 family)
LEQAAPAAPNNKAGLAQKAVDLCDQILSLGRSKGPLQPPGIVGKYETMTGPSGIMGLTGMAVDEAWDKRGRELDDLARRLAQTVKALDPAYPTDTFYRAGRPRPLIDCYPRSAWQIPESERKAIRAHVRSPHPGKSDAEIERIAGKSDELTEARAKARHTKPQWPGSVTQEDGHLLFVSDPGLVHEFEQRFIAIRLWASQFVEDAVRQAARDKKATPKKRRRPPLAGSVRPLTAKQTEALYVLAQCNGNYAEAARRLKIDRKSFEERCSAAYGKLGQKGMKRHATEISKALISRLPRDLRGQEALAADDDGPAALEGRKPQVPRNRRG